MLLKFIMIIVSVHLVSSIAMRSTVEPESENRTKSASKFSVDQLLTSVFPKKVSNDIDLDPCKAETFLGDIALPNEDLAKQKKKDAAKRQEAANYKQEVLEGLQIEEEGLTDIVRKKTKQASPFATETSYNDPLSGYVPTKTTHKNEQDLKLRFVLNDERGNIKPESNDGIINKKQNISENLGISQNNGNVDTPVQEDNRGHPLASAASGQQIREVDGTGKHHNRRKRHGRKRRLNRNSQPEHFDLLNDDLPETPIHDFEPNFDLRRSAKLKKHTSYNEETSHRRVTRAATARQERVWDYGVIPYEIDGNFSGGHKALFKQAMRHWENVTCVKFVERNKDDHPNYIVFTEKPCGCCSFVGKRGNGGQAISIGKNCDKFGIVVHELGHVVGFWHEHTRPDRDNHVNIIRENIMSGQEYNFNKLNEEEVNSLGLTYDYDSIMHYARNTFSKGTFLDTIQPIDVPGRQRPEIGQRLRLSQGDIAQTNLLYNCPKCGQTYQLNSGTFSAPSYVHKKPPEGGDRCEWRITATHGEKIVLNITDLDIEKSPNCNANYIEIRDGYWHKSPLLGKFCGTGKVDAITSTGSRMLITYVNTNPIGHRGYTASYEAICGGDFLLDTEGHLESPNYPEEYQPNKECIWRITVPTDYQVALRFQSFEVENHDGCVYDYVEIRDGLTADSPLIGVHCGYKTPADIISSSNHLFVKFVSDLSVQKPGFSATIMKEYDECNRMDHGCEQICVNTLGSYECGCKLGYELHSDGKNCEDACGGILDAPNGTITSPSFPDFYPLGKNCIWEIRAPPQYRITLNFTHFDLEGNNIHHAQHQQCDYDRIEVYSKLSDDKLKKHGVYCGSKAPNHITSEGNFMRIVFSSDTSIQKTGFAAVFFTDMDECAVNNGGCQHECLNTLGSYTCTCHNGFTLHENGRDCKEGGCKYEITTPYGGIGSPNYPDYYPSRKDCVWHIITTPGHRIRISFTIFEVEPHQECSYDHVDFYDGPNQESHLLGRFCGSKLPNFIVSSGNQLYMTFKSDASVQRKGFWASHATVCGGILQATFEKKHIYSHARFGTADYDNRADCDWTIQAMSGYNVRLSFLTFDVEDEKQCLYDYVEIFSGMDSSSPTFGRFCGSTKPFDIVSTNEALLVRFVTDDTLTSKGFSIVYEAVEASSFEEM